MVLGSGAESGCLYDTPVGELQEVTSLVSNSSRHISSNSAPLGGWSPSGHAHTSTNTASSLGDVINLGSHAVTKPLLSVTVCRRLLPCWVVVVCKHTINSDGHNRKVFPKKEFSGGGLIFITVIYTNRLRFLYAVHLVIQSSSCHITTPSHHHGVTCIHLHTNIA